MIPPPCLNRAPHCLANLVDDVTVGANLTPKNQHTTNWHLQQRTECVCVVCVVCVRACVLCVCVRVCCVCVSV